MPKKLKAPPSILIKKLESVQTCAMLRDVCVGKTGTLTESNITVKSYQITNDKHAVVDMDHRKSDTMAIFARPMNGYLRGQEPLPTSVAPGRVRLWRQLPPQIEVAEQQCVHIIDCAIRAQHGASPPGAPGLYHASSGAGGPGLGVYPWSTPHETCKLQIVHLSM